MVSITEIQNVLYPFLLVDRIIELEPRKRAVGIKNVTINESFFQGHFPGRPIMPGVLTLEAMSQVGGVAILYPDEYRSTLAYTAAINKVKIRVQVKPGDQLRIVAEVTNIRTKTVKTWAQTFIDDKIAAEGEFVFCLLPTKTF